MQYLLFERKIKDTRLNDAIKIFIMLCCNDFEVQRFIKMHWGVGDYEEPGAI